MVKPFDQVKKINSKVLLINPPHCQVITPI